MRIRLDKCLDCGNTEFHVMNERIMRCVKCNQVVKIKKLSDQDLKKFINS
jgi:hypothetical protein